MDAEELRRRWAVTLGNQAEASGWPTVQVDQTCRPANDETVATIAAATLDGLRTHGAGDATASSSAMPPADSGFICGAELGRGGMGVVYRARQRSLQRDVAIKLVRREAATPASQQAFVSEALVNGLLDHPNIVPVHELGTDGAGQIFLAMKLVDGVSWRDLLHPRTEAQRAASASWTLARHLGVLDAVANAVAFAHSKGIVHRDLKPENVMVGAFGEVLVMDWGIAVDIRERPDGDLRTRHRSDVHAPAGTPCYMAPEQAEGRGADLGPWTDVFLLGAILHEILTGSPPHRGSTMMTVLLAASRAEPPEFPATVPAGLAAICRRALARNHLERYPTVTALQDALREQARHRASEEVATRARADAERARQLDRDGGPRDARYAAYAEAIAGFRQACSMWPENRAASADERSVRLAYAAAARDGGDLGLAEVQIRDLAPGDDLDRERSAIAERRAADAARERSARRQRILLTVSVLAIIGGSLTAALVVNHERSRTAEQRDKAVAAERDAREQQQEAQRQRDAAQREAWNARVLVTGNQYRDAQPNAQAEAAMALHLARRIHPDLAPAGGGSSTDLARRLWARFALAQRPPAPRWSSADAGPLRGVRVVGSGLLVVPAAGDVRVVDDQGAIRCRLAKLDGSEVPSDLAWNQDDDGTVRAFSVGPTRAVHLAAKPGEEATIRIWDLETGGKLRTWRLPDVSAIALSTDERHVVVANGEEGAILSVEEGRELLSFFWRNPGRWSDGRKGSFAGLQVDGVLVEDFGEYHWRGMLAASFLGRATAATTRPDEPAERRFASAHLPDLVQPTDVSRTSSDTAVVDPTWGLVVRVDPLPVRIGPAVADGTWTARTRADGPLLATTIGERLTVWQLDLDGERRTLEEGGIEFDEAPDTGGFAALLPSGRCILALDSSIHGEGYLTEIDPASAACPWRMKIEQQVSALSTTPDGAWLAVASRCTVRDMAPAVPPWLLRRQSDGRTWSLGELLGEDPQQVRFQDRTLVATMADGRHLRLALSEGDLAAAAMGEPAAGADPVWVTPLGGPSPDGVLAIAADGIRLAGDGRVLRRIDALHHAWFTADGRTVLALAWDGRATWLRRIPLIADEVPASLPPLVGHEARWESWAAAEPAIAHDDGLCTMRPLPAGNPP